MSNSTQLLNISYTHYLFYTTHDILVHFAIDTHYRTTIDIGSWLSLYSLNIPPLASRTNTVGRPYRCVTSFNRTVLSPMKCTIYPVQSIARLTYSF